MKNFTKSQILEMRAEIQQSKQVWLCRADGTWADPVFFYEVPNEYLTKLGEFLPTSKNCTNKVQRVPVNFYGKNIA